MIAAPITASRPDPHRNSEYASSSTNTCAFRFGAAPSVNSGTTPQTPKAMATISNGRVRRHNKVNTSATTTTTETTRHGRSGRRIPSSTATGTSTATSTQSRHTRAGARGGRGSSHTDRRISCTH
jgi:hypothetical protein